ncbi:hypothetical protein CSAL01_12511 [Colletotrichum salicis]|uniref:Uncharacterized protein n=1 Tax=Colletotrichum salicis TaxID=1209931 RepID=A0A135UKT8_9PEZI|nr:hypothetical protein CSAL01_12511 [Colletotrichum salicis]
MTDPSPGNADPAPVIHQLLDVVKRFHSPATGASAWNTRAPLLAGGQPGEGHIPRRFVPLLERVREAATFPSTAATTEGSRLDMSTRACRAPEDMICGGRTSPPELLAWSTAESGRGAPSRQLGLPIPSISQLSWAETDCAPYRVILILISGVSHDQGRSLWNDDVYVEFGDEDGEPAELHYCSFLSWSQAFLPWATKISNDELSKRWDSPQRGTEGLRSPTDSHALGSMVTSGTYRSRWHRAWFLPLARGERGRVYS